MIARKFGEKVKTKQKIKHKHEENHCVTTTTKKT